MNSLSFTAKRGLYLELSLSSTIFVKHMLFNYSQLFALLTLLHFCPFFFFLLGCIALVHCYVGHEKLSEFDSTV